MPMITVENEIKKNVIEVETWYHSEKDIYIQAETGWRFSKYTLEVDEDFDIDQIDKENEHGFCVSEYHVEDMESSDSFSFDFNYAVSQSKELTEEQEESILEEVLNLWEEDGWWGLENAGWEHEDTEVWIYGPLIIEEVKNGD
jgi:hypothetical protein